MPLYLTYALTLVCFSGITMTRVVLSLYALELGAPASAIGILVASMYAFPLVFSWPLGMLSDRFGARWLLLFGTLCGAGAMAVPYFVRELFALYVAATMTGLSFLCYNILLQNLVGLLSAPHERARNFSNSSLIGSATNVIGPLIAGFGIDHSGYAVACLYVVGLSLAAAAMLVIWGGVLPGSRRSTAPSGSILETLADPGILRIIATSCLVQIGQDLYQFYLPVYAHGIGLSASAIGIVLANFSVATFVVRIFMPRLIRRLGEETLLGYSFYVGALGLALVPFFTSVAVLGMISFIFGLGMGCCHPITTMLLFGRSAEGRSGETIGVRQTASNITRVTAPTLFGFIASAFGLLPVFCITAVLLAAGGRLSRLNTTSRGARD